MAAPNSIKTKLISLATVMLICAHSAFAAAQTVAVLPSEGVLNPNELEFLTNKAQEIAVRVLPRGTFEVFPRDVIIRRLGGVENYLKECREAACIVDLGKKAQVDYVSQCSFGKLGSDLTIAFELYKVSTSGLVDKFTERAKNINGLLAIMEKRIPEGFAKILEPPPEAKTAPPEPPPPPPPEPPPTPPPSEPAPVVAPAVASEPEFFVVPATVLEPEIEPAVAPPAVKKECESTFNINELVSQIQSGFTTQLKDCSATLAKNMALAASPFGKKTEQPEPKAFMMECVIDGMKQKLVAGAAEYIKPIESFVQNILSAASASGGGLDVKKLSSVISDMDVGELLDGIRKLASEDDCAKDEPYEPPAAVESGEDGSGEEGRKIFSWGIRAGFNFSHLYSTSSGSYNSTPGLQLGMVFDWALTDWFHLQPGIMYIQKGAEDYYGDVLTLHYLEFPLLLSLKSSYGLRINAGPYFGICLDASESNISCGSYEYSVQGISGGGNGGPEGGIIMSLGFDIGMFYVGVFYDIGLVGHVIWSKTEDYHDFIDRTLGFNFGVNL